MMKQVIKMRLVKISYEVKIKIEKKISELTYIRIIFFDSVYIREDYKFYI